MPVLRKKAEFKIDFSNIWIRFQAVRLKLSNFIA